MSSRVLVVAAHPDDEVLGIGATIAKRVLSGDECHCVILGEGITARGETRDEYDGNEQIPLKRDAMESAQLIGFSSLNFENLPDVRFDSLNLLDIVHKVQQYFFDINPDVVYTHHYGDLNIDHRLTFEAVSCACRPVPGWYPSEFYCFETPSSTEWNFGRKEMAFYPNTYVDVEDTIEIKLKAMSCYKGEIRDYPHPRSLDILRALAMKRGSEVNCRFAEAFELITRIIK